MLCCPVRLVEAYYRCRYGVDEMASSVFRLVFKRNALAVTVSDTSGSLASLISLFLFCFTRFGVRVFLSLCCKCVVSSL